MTLLVALTQNANDYSEWNTAPAGTAYSIAAAAGMNGTAYGLRLDPEGTSTQQGIGVNNAGSSTGEYRLGFYIDIGGLTLPSTVIVDNWLSAGDDLNGDILQVTLIEISGAIYLRCEMPQSGGSYDTQDITISQSGDFHVELRFVKGTSSSSNDGINEIFIDGSPVYFNPFVDNFTELDTNDVDYLHLHPVSVLNGTATGTFDVDEITLRDDDTGILEINEFRYLGMVSDSGKLYVTGNKNGILSLYDYDLGTLSEGSVVDTFGIATNAEIDAQTRGVLPIIRPMTDQILYLYGRDGNNVQVQYNDKNGTLGWVDIGAGTATWATSKFAVALMPAEIGFSDIVVSFSDDDSYWSILGGGTSQWVKTGDATTGLRGAWRHPVDGNEFMYGGTVAGTLHYSHNYGVSYDDASGTALGTINHIEYVTS